MYFLGLGENIMLDYSEKIKSNNRDREVDVIVEQIGLWLNKDGTTKMVRQLAYWVYDNYETKLKQIESRHQQDLCKLRLDISAQVDVEYKDEKQDQKEYLKRIIDELYDEDKYYYYE